MRVAVLSHMFPKFYDEVSGLFVLQQAEALKALDCSVTVVCPIPWVPATPHWISARWANIRAMPRTYSMRGIPIIYPRYMSFPRGIFFSSSGWRMKYPVKKAVCRLLEIFEFDLIHVHTAIPDGVAGIEIARSLDCPIVVTVHGQDIHHTILLNTKAENEVRRVLLKAERVVFVSHSLRKKAEEQLGQLPNAVVIHNGADVSSLRTASESYTPDSRIVLTVAGLTKEKGIDTAIYAVNELVKRGYSIRYLIVGDGPEMKPLQALSRKLGVSDNIEFLGTKAHDVVLGLMAVCDVFCLPSYREGFGIVYAEAMALGKPVVGCKGEGVSDFVEHGHTGFLIEPHCYKSLARILSWILDHPSEARCIGKRGQSVAIKELTWEVNARKMVEIYADVIRKRKNSPHHDSSLP